jgi:hypothetical protein
VKKYLAVSYFTEYAEIILEKNTPLNMVEILDQKGLFSFNPKKVIIDIA